MSLQQFLNILHQELDLLYGKEEVDSFFNILIEFHLKLKRTSYLLNPELEISESVKQQLLNALNRLKQNEPIQYTLGETYFYGLNFKVTKDALIPRPETEELVHWLLQTQKTINNESPVILDMGTGSGCIAVSIAKHLPKAQVFAMDISKAALEIAAENAKRNKVNVHFIEANILKPKTLETKIPNTTFDILISNPPYVTLQEKDKMKPNVLDFEPHQSLFVTNHNPLQFYNAITKFALNKLKPNGFLFFEINQYLGKETQQLLKSFNFEEVQLKKDLFGNDRMLKARKKL